MKSISEFVSSGSKEKFLNKKEPGEVGEVCDGSVHGKMEIDLDNCEDNFTESCNDQEDTENDSGSINSGFNDGDHTEFDKNYELQVDIKQWAIRNNISHSALNELSAILNKRIKYALPRDARTILKTNNKTIDVTTGGTGHYWHNCLIDQLRKVLAIVDQIPNLISLNINIDGLPIYNSSRQQFWPILCSIFEIPKLSPLIIGIYAGTSKPSNLSAYLDPMVTELKQLENGLVVKSKTGNDVIVTVQIRAFICDSPARAFIKGVANFNSKHGCLKCTVVGEYSHVSHAVTFPTYDCPKRNNEDFRAKKYEEHHKQDSPLLQLKIDMIENFPVADSLHLIDLGLMKRLLLGWRDGNFGKYLTKWSARDIEKINSFLSKCRMPTEIHRSVGTIDVLAHWKGSEYRTFLYYHSIIILKYVLNYDAYFHFLNLYCAIRICSNEKHFIFLQIADQMLAYFIQNFKIYYGKDYITSNIHNLKHVVDEVRKYGKLHSFNAYPFENKLYTIKRMIRHGNKPLQQVAKRLNEQLTAEIEHFHEDLLIKYPFIKTYQRKGVLKHVLHFESYILSTQKENKWFLSDQDHVVELNSICFEDTDEINEILLNGHRITQIQNVFDKPLKSSFLDIYKCDCNNINKIEAVYGVKNVKCKLVCIEFNSELFFIPLLHTL
ncbi:hypothetical protein evm_001568 [Chilo suppressalis]|nr:hypothetical protein evm_001568 [Chilo suppressalis]